MPKLGTFLMVSELIDKYIWLVQSLIDAGPGGLSLEEISRKWTNRYGGSEYPRRSFNNHREAVAEVFGIDIACNRSTNRYYIDAGESAVDKRQSVEWLVNTFTVNNLLSLGKERLSGRVSVEDIPSGHRWLVAVMQAMLDDGKMELRYRKYLSEGEEVRHIRPYAVKEFAKRWYVVAFSEEAAAIRVYAMDRILSLEPTGEKFRMPKGFSVDALFESSYGIYPPEDEPPVLVRFRTTEREAAYLKDLPIHPSQVFLGKDADGKSLFAMRLIPNPDLVMELCRHGNRLEVLEPASLREKVAEELRKALLLYE
ncbi:MAG: WYL domain-containing protein [Bacteroidales bacterium]|nr:WYL domain-containing protein [Bacteroidales bacterium]